jgi:uncharacterized protein YkwD
MLTASTASGASVGSGCPHATSLPSQATIPQLRRATICLLNGARGATHLRSLAVNVHLARMANRHSKLMVANDCFEHTCTGEDPLPKRLKTSGYLAGARMWAYAEDLGYESTPKQMVGRWLRVSYDRENLLSHKYVDVGIGLAEGSPDPHASDKKFVTYTVDLAWRKPPV